MPSGLSAWHAATGQQAATLKREGIPHGDVQALEAMTRGVNGRVQLAAEDRARAGAWRALACVCRGGGLSAGTSARRC